MIRMAYLAGIGAILAQPLLFTGSAQALNLVSYIAVGGSGSACTYSAPCSSFANALAQTEPSGEIRCLDGVNNNAISITKPITFECGATGAATGAITLTLVGITIDIDEATFPNAVVTLRNLILDGFPDTTVFSSGVDGIRFIGGGAALHIENCKIFGFAQQGIEFVPTSSADLFIRDTIISNNAGGGVLIKPTGAGGATSVLDNVGVDGNATGITIDGRTTTGSIKATVRESTIGGSTSFGLFAVESGSGTTEVTVADATSANNGAFGIGANGAGATVRVKNSTVTGNANGLVAAAGSSLVSLGGNNVVGNTTNGAFTSTLAQQ